MQLKLSTWVKGCYYECVNSNCFYCEHQQQYDTVVFRSVYNHQTELLEHVPYCPSCDMEMIFWHEDGNTTPV